MDLHKDPAPEAGHSLVGRAQGLRIVLEGGLRIGLEGGLRIGLEGGYRSSLVALEGLRDRHRSGLVEGSREVGHLELSMKNLLAIEYVWTVNRFGDTHMLDRP